jgi:hypothetical protein
MLYSLEMKLCSVVFILPSSCRIRIPVFRSSWRVGKRILSMRRIVDRIDFGPFAFDVPVLEYRQILIGASALDLPESVIQHHPASSSIIQHHQVLVTLDYLKRWP